MRWIWTVIFGLIASLSVPATEVSLQYTNPPVGTLAVESSQTLMEFKLNAKAPNGDIKNSFEQSVSGSKKREATVLAAGTDAPSKVKVHYELFEQKFSRTGMDPKTREEPVNGKTFVVESKDAGITATNEKGEAVSADEEKSLRVDLRILFQSPNRFAQLFGGKKFNPGQSVEISDELREDLIGGGTNGMKIITFALVFKETRTINGMECAVFTQDVRMGKKDKTLSLSVELHGETVVGMANCWPVAVKLSGPILIGGEQGDGANKVTMEGQGKMLVSWEVSYGK